MVRSTYTRGSAITLSGVFTDEASGLPADPTNVAVLVREPSGVIQTLTSASTPPVVRDGTGLYHLDYAPDSTLYGRFTYRFEGTGAVEAAGERSFWVDRGAFV